MSSVPATKSLPQAPDGQQWAWVVINTSGGKDSTVAMLETLTCALEAGVPKDRIVLSHQSLGRMEWKGVIKLLKAHAEALDLPLRVSAYRDKNGESLTLLDYARKRGKWPDSKNRWCTSEFKRGPGGRLITELSKLRPGHVLQVFGFRAEESTARAKRPVLQRNRRFSRAGREVWDWLPVHDWTTSQVWAAIRRSGLPHHHAYDLGMPRFSCVVCIFAPRAALMIAGKENPELLDEYCDVEISTGHKFRQDLSLVELREDIRKGVNIEKEDLDKAWNM